MPAADAISQFEEIYRKSALLRTWPVPKEQVSWRDALELAGASAVAGELEACAKTARASLPMVGHPIVGVLGQLNAGKSSVVASFLSQKGKDRLPRGLHDAQGTHRFVYWLPQSWQHGSAVWEPFCALLEAAHGSQVEYLDEDATLSAVQYGSGLGKPDVIRRPLIAFDAGLNDQGFALLDCPDVQTRDVGVPELTARLNPRIEFLCQAAKVCSTFLYVWEASKLNEALFSDLLKEIRSRTPDVPTLILVNKIKPVMGEPTLTRASRALSDATVAIGVSPKGIYGAFDHDVNSRTDGNGHAQPGWVDLTPPPLVQRNQVVGGPQFFALVDDHAENSPHAVEASRFLHIALTSLPPAELQRSHLSSTIKTLARESEQAVDLLRSFVSARAEMAQTRQLHLLQKVNEVFTDPKTKQPTQLPDPQVLAALRDSITEHAPLAIRAIMNVRSFTEQFVTRPIKDAITWLRNDAFTWLVEKIRDGVLILDEGDREKLDKVRASLKHLSWNSHSSADIAHSLMAQRWFPTDVEESCVIKAIDKAFRQLAKSVTENPDIPPKTELDKHAKRIWARISAAETSMIFFSTLLGVFADVIALGSIVLVVVDGGATFLQTTLIQNAISSQLALVGIFGGQTVAVLSDLDSSLARFSTIPAVSKLFAMLCDAFGVPRPSNFSKLTVHFGPPGKSKSYGLIDPGIKVKPAVCPLGDQTLWREEPSGNELGHWAADNA